MYDLIPYNTSFHVVFIRAQLVQGLQKEGPWALKALKENHLLEFVDSLILEKKWVEETVSHMFPFKLTFPAKGRSFPSDVHGSNGLSSLFTGKTSRFNMQNISEQEKQDQNHGPPRNSLNGRFEAKVPQNISALKAWFQKISNGTENMEPEDFRNLFERKFNRKLLCSSYGYSTVQGLIAACLADNNEDQTKKRRPSNREEVLSDCHKLLAQLLEANPQGFNIGLFRPMFIERYGYLLDYQTLGYPKLASLLQIMPGVRIESSYILPEVKFHSDSSQKKFAIDGTLAHSLEPSNGKVVSLDNEDSANPEDRVWEELGPVSETNICENSEVNEEIDEQVEFNEVFLSDEEFSNSEDDTAIHFDGSGGHKKGKEDSSLLQILDSWYSSKEGGEDLVDGLVDCSTSNKQDPLPVKPTDSPKPKVKIRRNYSFVSESRDGEKEKLVDSILGSLKKSADSRLHS